MLKTQPIAISPIDDSSSTDAEAWLRACNRLRTEFGEALYGSWFARLELDEVRGNCAILSVPTRFLKSWIHAHYFERLKTVVVDEIAGVGEISIGLRTTGRMIAPRIEAQEAQPRRNPHETRHGAATWPAVSSDVGCRPQSDGLEGSPLDRRMAFANFLVGQSNQLAYAAAIQVSTVGHAASAMFNPLYIHAAVGLGKTHLLQAVAQASAEAGRRVIYLTAEKFMYGFVSALKTQNAITFKDKLRAIDVLVIDDVQFLQGKSIQHEFCHTLNALIDAGRQIIIAADRPPAELENLDERVRSRFSGGLCVEMQALDEPLRVKILEARIAVAKAVQPGFDVSRAVVAMVARTIDSNGRDLDGAVNRLVAHTTLAGTALTLEAAESAIRDLVRAREPRRVKIEDIQKLVATHFNVSRADVLSSRRTANVVRPRQVAMYLSKMLTPRSLPEIGRLFGGRDHTTVLHGIRKIEGLLGKDGSLSDEVALLKRMLGN